MCKLMKIIGSSTDSLIITNYASVFASLVHQMCGRSGNLLFDTELRPPPLKKMLIIKYGQFEDTMFL